MTIKLRIILGFFLSTVILATSIMIDVLFTMRQSAVDAYETASSQQLELVNANVDALIGTAKRDMAVLARDPLIMRGVEVAPIFEGNNGKTLFRHSDLLPEARTIAKRFLFLEQEEEQYAEVFAGYKGGGFITSQVESTLGASFLPEKRGWYMDRVQSGTVAGLTESYLSTSGEIVVCVSHSIRDTTGKLVGVAAVDISLSNLSKLFDSLNFGESGYFLLMEDSGRILCDPGNPENIAKYIGKEVTDAGLKDIREHDKGMLTVTIGGKDFFANIMTTEYGWKIASIQAVDEIFAPVHEAIINITIISLITVVVVLLLAYYIMRSINIPLRRLVGYADKVARGDLAEELGEKGFYGELASLKGSLENMVQHLSEMIGAAEEKSREAEQQASLAHEATEEANKARQEAEHARQEGMLSAAQQLEDIVASLFSASTQLSSQIEQSSTIAKESAERLETSATGMNEMNATVHEVANSATMAADASEETRRSAQQGEEVVRQVLTSIGNVQNHSIALKDDVTRLSEHAKDISQIMSVISDIADQTNLLALNAAIEAARAGDAGRGFSVVADEVRKLAEKTMDSTHDVDRVIRVIQESTAKSVHSVDNALQQVETANVLANQSGEALSSIVTNVDTAADQVRAIATASEEQSMVSEEITSSISHVNELSQQTAISMRDAAAAVSDLAVLAQQLRELIEKMKDS